MTERCYNYWFVISTIILMFLIFCYGVLEMFYNSTNGFYYLIGSMINFVICLAFGVFGWVIERD